MDKTSRFLMAAVVTLGVAFIGPGLRAQDECPCGSRRTNQPASLLLFPEFCNLRGYDTLVTITNADCFACNSDNPGGQLPPAEVIVEVVFINKDTCLEDNFNLPLTPCDQTSFLTRVKTNFRQGYLYAFAKNQAGKAISFNHLIGQEVILDGFKGLEWSANAAGFQAIPDEGLETDLDHDNVRDLDNREYLAAPERILIPRFLGQDPLPNFFATYRSTLTLINLSGGVQFRTIVDLSIFNDNEECFSRQWEFKCWDKQFLADITPAFTEAFLKSSNNDPGEIDGWPWPGREAGWLIVNGRTSYSSAESIADPAVYAMLVEEKWPLRVADLPWEEGCQENGDLLPTGILGDPIVNGQPGTNHDDQ
jgi:hypothetical protein